MNLAWTWCEHERTQNFNFNRGFRMKKHLFVSLSFVFLSFVIAPVSGAIDTGFSQAADPTALILLATGLVGLFSFARGSLNRSTHDTDES